MKQLFPIDDDRVENPTFRRLKFLISRPFFDLHNETKTLLSVDEASNNLWDLFQAPQILKANSGGYLHILWPWNSSKLSVSGIAISFILTSRSLVVNNNIQTFVGYRESWSQYNLKWSFCRKDASRQRQFGTDYSNRLHCSASCRFVALSVGCIRKYRIACYVIIFNGLITHPAYVLNVLMPQIPHEISCRPQDQFCSL